MTGSFRAFIDGREALVAYRGDYTITRCVGQPDRVEWSALAQVDGGIVRAMSGSFDAPAPGRGGEADVAAMREVAARAMEDDIARRLADPAS